MSWLAVCLLAIVQGITEFLPISSSGHLVLVEDWLGINEEILDLNIVLHLGTLISILIIYRRRVLEMLFTHRRLLALVIVGTVPAVVAGLILKYQFKHALESPLVAGCLLPVTGLLLFWAHGRDPQEKTAATLTFRDALLIGCFQAVAVLPGISRSGTTIAAGLLVGLKREDSAAFSFLLALPVLSGAALLEGLSIWKGEPLTTPAGMLIAGMIVSAVVGVFALKWLIAVLQRGNLKWFGAWCVTLGMIVIVWSLLNSTR